MCTCEVGPTSPNKDTYLLFQGLGPQPRGEESPRPPGANPLERHTHVGPDGVTDAEERPRWRLGVAPESSPAQATSDQKPEGTGEASRAPGESFQVEGASKETGSPEGGGHWALRQSCKEEGAAGGGGRTAPEGPGARRTSETTVRTCFYTHTTHTRTQAHMCIHAHTYTCTRAHMHAPPHTHTHL